MLTAVVPDGGGALVGVGQRRAGDAVLDGGPGREQDVVLVHAHHVGALALQHADDSEGDVLDAHLLADRRLRRRTARGPWSGRAGRPCWRCARRGSVKGSPSARSSSRGPQVRRRRAVDVAGHPVAVAVDDLRAGADDGGDVRDGGAFLEDGVASSGVSVMMLPAPKLTPPLAAVPGMTSRLLAPMLAMVFWMAADEPLPISIMAMTAATPMMMPSVVSAARMMLRRRARNAVSGCASDLHAAPPAGCRRGATCRTVLDQAVADVDDAPGVPRHFAVVGHQDDREALLAG